MGRSWTVQARRSLDCVLCSPSTVTARRRAEARPNAPHPLLPADALIPPLKQKKHPAPPNAFAVSSLCNN